MRPPEELGTVDWSGLEHAYGAADDVPDLVRALYSAQDEEYDEVVVELAGCIFHQGSLYSATAAVVPFLAHAAVSVPDKADRALVLLVLFAQESSRSADPDAVEVGRAVRAELPELLRRCLPDGGPEMRRAAVRLAGTAVGPLVAESVDALERTFESDRDPRVRADALTALGLLLPEESRQARRRAEALRSPWREVRLAAALLDLDASPVPYPPAALSVVAVDGAAEAESSALPFPRAPEERLTELLLADAEGALHVAQRWVAHGDVGSRGSWLARGLVHRWRGVEAPVVAMMLDAFPRQNRAAGARSRLDDAAFWMPYAGPQSEEVRQLLLRRAVRADAETDAGTDAAVADAACRALAGMGDLTILEDRCDASGWALAILLTHHRAAALPSMAAVLSRALVPGKINDAVVAALRPGDAAGRAGEIKELLRTPGHREIAAEMLGAGLLPAAEADAEMIDLLAAGTADEDIWRSTRSAVAHAFLTGSSRSAVQVIGPQLRRATLQPGILRYIGRLGQLGAPLLGDLRRLLERSDATGVVAADAYWRISGDAHAVLPTLTRVAGSRRDAEPSVNAIQALATLAELGHLPEQLRCEVEEFALSRRRVVSVGGPVELPHRDERLRRAACRLLGQVPNGCAGENDLE